MFKILKKEKALFKWVIASIICVFGDVFTSTAIPLISYKNTGSSGFMALVFLGDIIPKIILAPLIGAKIDRLNKKKTLILSNVLSAILLLIIIYVKEYIYIYILINSIVSINSMIYLTTAKTILPDVIDEKENISKVNAFITFALKLTRVVGITFASLLLSFTSVNVLFIVDSITFALSAFFVFIIDSTRFKIIENDNNLKTNLLKDFKSGFYYFISDKKLIIITFYYALLFFIRGVIFTQLVVFIVKDIGLPSHYLSYANNLILLGIFIGQIILSKRNNEKYLKTAFFSLLLLCGSIFLMVILLDYRVLLFYGIVEIFLVNSWFAYFYTQTQKEYRARVVSLSDSIFNIFQTLGILTTYILTKYVTISSMYLITVSVVIIFTILLAYNNPLENLKLRKSS